MISAGNIGDQNFAFFRDYEEWKKEISQSACSVYELPSSSFTNTISKADGRPTVEWLSSEVVSPNRIIRYTPEMVMETGGQLFFLDAKVTGETWHYEPDKSSNATFLNRLQAKRDAGILPSTFTPMHLARELMDAGIMRHLNADVGIKPITLEKSPDGVLIKEDIDWLKEQMISKSVPIPTGKVWAKALGPRTGCAAAIAE